MSKTYHIDVTVDDKPVANAYGNARVIAFVAKDAVSALAESGAKGSVTLTEVVGIGGETKDTIMDVTADAQSVGFLLKRNLTAIRKADKDADNEITGHTEQENDANASDTRLQAGDLPEHTNTY